MSTGDPELNVLERIDALNGSQKESTLEDQPCDVDEFDPFADTPAEKEVDPAPKPSEPNQKPSKLCFTPLYQGPKQATLSFGAVNTKKSSKASPKKHDIAITPAKEHDTKAASATKEQEQSKNSHEENGTDETEKADGDEEEVEAEDAGGQEEEEEEEQVPDEDDEEMAYLRSPHHYQPIPLFVICVYLRQILLQPVHIHSQAVQGK
jgi:hypothetical protein